MEADAGKGRGELIGAGKRVQAGFWTDRGYR